MGVQEQEHTGRGVAEYWVNVNHIAIVVSDVGTSLAFYTDVVGFQQVIRPDFDRHGAWLTMGNVDLHLIKGRPAVHPDDDLKVSHIALTVSGDKMKLLREKLDEMGIKYRKNVSVPNPAVLSGKHKGQTDQSFVRDPDGYYIEFCACESLEDYLTNMTASATSLYKDNEWDVSTMSGMIMGVSGKLKSWRKESTKAVIEMKKMLEEQDVTDGGEVKPPPDWLIPDIDATDAPEDSDEVDQVKLRNLLKRRKAYGDITQNATEKQIARLMLIHKNDVPSVIGVLDNWVRTKKTQTYIPPPFYERDGSFVQPPSFEMPLAAVPTPAM